MRTTDQPENPFATDHLYLAAYLVCQGHLVSNTETGETGRISFVFVDSDEVHRAVADFMAGALVNARQFSFTVLRLKKLLPRMKVKTVRTMQNAGQYSLP